MNNINPRFKLILFSLILLIGIGFGCKKDNSPDVESSNDVDSTVQDISPYISRIKKYTHLIQSVVSDTTYQTYEGFKVTRVNYINTENAPLTVFFLTVDLSKSNISLEVGTAFNKPDYKHQTVSDMITYKNEGEPLKMVIAAVNGDYWQVHSGKEVPLSHPLGIVYKKGTMIKDFPKGTYYFFGILKDKTACIGDQMEYAVKKGNIEEGLGGRYLLLHHGVNLSGSLNRNVEPRTAVGILSKTKVVFIVVDGRRAEYSVGVSMQTLATLFQAIGATDAINLDGGGSTTLVLKSGGKYITENKPSGNAERAVVNSWMVMYKK